MNYTINQKAWYVARVNFKTHKVEYLDNDRDVFYCEGVKGYATKAEAHQRADRYQGDLRNVFIQGPNYGRYRLEDRRSMYQKSFNTTLARFKIMDRFVFQATENQDELAAELRKMLHDFAISNGIWQFSGLSKMKDFIDLCSKYGALSDAEMVRLIYETKE